MKVLKVMKNLLLGIPAVTAVVIVALPTIFTLNVIAGEEILKVSVADKDSNNETEK